MASKYEPFPGMTDEEVLLFNILREIELLNTGGGGTVTSVNGQTGVVNLDSDNIAEGSINLYFTEGRVLDTLLTGFVLGTNTPITATDSVLEAFQNLQAQITSGFTNSVVNPSTSTDNAIVRWDGITGKLVQNSNAILLDNGNLFLSNPALADGESVLTISGTQPASPSSSQLAVLVDIASNGSATQNNVAFYSRYTAGYTGPNATYAGSFSNSVLGSAKTLIPAAGSNASLGNFGANAGSTGTINSLNAGFFGFAAGGDISAGIIGLAQVDKTGAINIGVTGSAINTIGVAVGGFFSLNRTTLPVTTSALTADNGSQTSDIFRADDNGVNVFRIADGGTVSIASLTSGSILFAGASGAISQNNTNINWDNGTTTFKTINTQFTTVSLLDSTYKTVLDVPGSNILRIGSGFTGQINIGPDLMVFTTALARIRSTMAGTTLQLETTGGTTANNGVTFLRSADVNNTSGTNRMASLSATFNPASGTGNIVGYSTTGLIVNQTGTASGVISLFNAGPTVTSVTGTLYGFRSQIAASPIGGGTAWGVYADGTAPNGFGGDIRLLNAGNGIYIKQGTNATSGRATLVAGTVTVNTTKITANSDVYYCIQTVGGTPGFLRLSARVVGTSFTITSSQVTDTSVISWVIIEPA